MFKLRDLLSDRNHCRCIYWSFDLHVLRKPVDFNKISAEMRGKCSSTDSENGAELERDQRENIAHSKLFRFTKFVKMDDLTPQEKLIHYKHVCALQEGKEIYKDPVTGYDVLTRLAHLQRGKCCGNACRHCPFGHQKVSDSIPKRRFNSAFYV